MSSVLIVANDPRCYAAFQIPVILEPLCAIHRTRGAPVVRARIARGECQVSEATRDLRVHEVGPEAPAAYDLEGRLFVNVNTPHDYVRARTWVEGTSEPSSDRITE